MRGAAHFHGSAIGAIKIASHQTDLTAAQWELLQPFLPAAKKRGRPRTPLRALCDAIFYLAKAGCPWRLLPQTFPP